MGSKYSRIQVHTWKQWHMTEEHRTIQIHSYLSTYLKPIIHFSKFMWHHMTCDRFVFQHSPSNRVKSQRMSEMLGFGTRKRLSEEVCSHVLSWTINEFDRTLFDWVVNEMPPDINMPGSGVKLPVWMSKSNGGLVVWVEGDQVFKWMEDFSKKTSKPNKFLGSMRSGNVFRRSLHWATRC